MNNEAREAKTTTDEAAPVEPVVMCNIALTGEYHADCNLLMNEIARLRIGIEKITEVTPPAFSNLSPIETLAMSPTQLIKHVHELLGT